MKKFGIILAVFIFLGVLNAHAWESHNATVIMNDGKQVEVTIISFSDSEPIVKIKKRPVSLDEIDRIELIGELKQFIKTDGTVYSLQKAYVCLTENPEKKHKVTLRDFDQWLKESTNLDVNESGQTISQIVFHNNENTAAVSSQ